MEATTTQARKLSDIFATKTCTRCGGTGRHSYNMRDGDTCYGCSGSGKMWATKKVAAEVEAYVAAQRAARRRMAMDLTPGTIVLDTLAERATGGEKWTEVTGVTTTDRWAGKKLDGTVWAWYMVITLANGTERTVAGNSLVRTRAV